MANKLYVVGILLLWAGSMSWLISQRILPPLIAGDAPPNSLLNQREPVAWRLSVDGKVCGTSVLQAIADSTGVTEIHSRVQLDSISPPKAAPPWLAALGESFEALGLDVRTQNAFDPLGRLARFKMDVMIDEIIDPIVITGRIDSGKLRLRVRTGFLDKRLEHEWPDRGVLASELMPEAKVLSVYPGRKWRKEVFSPFSPPSAPVEMLEAEVVQRFKPVYDGQAIRACLVELRSPSAAGVSEEGRLRGTMLVSETGRVLRHETFMLGSKIVFDRLADRDAIALADELLDLDRRASMTTPLMQVKQVPASEPPVKQAPVIQGEPRSAPSSLRAD